MKLPQTPLEIRSERATIEVCIRTLEGQLKHEKAKLGVLQQLCPHPEGHVARWHSNPMGRWPTNHFKCNDCGLYKED